MGWKNSDLWGLLIQLAVLCGISGLIVVLISILVLGD